MKQDYAPVKTRDVLDGEYGGGIEYPHPPYKSCDKLNIIVLFNVFIITLLISHIALTSKSSDTFTRPIDGLNSRMDGALATLLSLQKVSSHMQSQFSNRLNTPVSYLPEKLVRNVRSDVPFHKAPMSALDGSKLNYHSQYGEDGYVVDNFFKQGENYLTNGVYFEIGALDGVEASNSYFFEHALNWTGYLVEASPKNYRNLLTRRSAEKNLLVGKAVCDKDTKSVEFTSDMGRFMGMIAKKDASHETIRVQCTTLDAIFAEKKTSRVDFLSLDVEGVEIDFLKQWPWSEVQLGVLMIEMRPEPKDYRYDLHNLLTAHGLEFYGDHRPSYPGTEYKFTRNVVYVNPTYVDGLMNFMAS